jgi:xanthine dehydrogenase YagR molybdenum-binding subunit
VAGSNLPVMRVAVVLAETQEQADHAAGLVSVTYAAEQAVTDFAAARAERARDPGTVIGEPSVVETGDAEKALAAATIGSTGPIRRRS